MRVVSVVVCAATIIASASTPAAARFKGFRSSGVTKPGHIVVIPRPSSPERSVEQPRRLVDSPPVGANRPTAPKPAPVAERRSAWEERCRPTLETGADGLQRYSYAASDCDLQILTSH